MPNAVPAHARVGDPHHVGHAAREQLRRDRQLAPLGHPGAALRARVPQHEHGVGVTSRAGSSMRAARSSMFSKTTAGPRWRSSLGSAGAALDHAPRPAPAMPAQHGEPALGRASGASSGAITSRSWPAAPATSSASVRPVTVSASRWSSGRELVEHGRDAAGAVQVLDEVLARGPHVRRAAASRGRARRTGRASSGTPTPPGQREQVDDRVGDAADGHQQRDRVVERLGGHDLRRPQPARGRARPRAAPVASAHARPGGVARPGSTPTPAAPSRAPRRSRSSSMPSPSRCSARRSAMHRRLELVELLVGHPPGADARRCSCQRSVPARARSPRKHAGSRRPAGDHDRRHVGAGRAHQLRPAPSCRTRASSTTASNGLARMRLLDVHRHQVAEEHRRRLHQVLAERDGRELERQPAGLQRRRA